MAVIKAIDLNKTSAIEIAKKLYNGGRYGLVKENRKQLTELGIYTGYTFNGWGCPACYNAIVTALFNGEILAKLEGTTKNTKKVSELKKYALTDLGKTKKGFQKKTPGKGIEIVKTENLTDADIAQIVKLEPYKLGLFFSEVEKPKRKATKKTEPEK